MRRPLIQFFRDGLAEVTSGGTTYHVWMAVLTLLMCLGAFAYTVQLREGLSATGMYDSVSWGLYISNFTFLVGVAAAAVTLVLPTYILHDVDFKQAVLIGEGLAVAALVMAIGGLLSLGARLRAKAPAPESSAVAQAAE